VLGLSRLTQFASESILTSADPFKFRVQIDNTHDTNPRPTIPPSASRNNSSLCLPMFLLLPNRSRLLFLGLLPPPTQLLHRRRFHPPRLANLAATKSIIVSEVLETSKEGVDLGRYARILDIVLTWKYDNDDTLFEMFYDTWTDI
jgi:hypothetical protein